ncbi:MAG TPA: enoyl-CoA hydratase [Micropepsaceae bacterium]|jgi:enoyl-CoA hydratase/carnithine racemase|nr:enoyl-CoA hydratase [Micropepsaceae bacterium]
MTRPTPLAPLLPTRANGVLTITLNRPEARNALSESLMRALQLTLDEAVDDADTKVIVVAAKGPVFSSGHDLKEMSAHRGEPDRGLAYYRGVFAQCSHLMLSIANHPKPVIAQVQGVATAAGCQLVASCDLAVASTEARFATPGVNIGLFCSTPMVALSRAVPRKAAMEMLLTGEAISAEDAKRLGLVNRVVAPEDLETETQALARFIAAKPVQTLKWGKQAFQHQLELGLSNAYDYVGEVMVQNMLHAEAVEGIGAFLDKRVPKWPES